MKATTSRCRIRKSSPKCSAESTRAPEFPRGGAEILGRGAKAPLEPQRTRRSVSSTESLIEWLGTSSSDDVVGRCIHSAQILRSSRLGKPGRSSLALWIGQVAGRTVGQSGRSSVPQGIHDKGYVEATRRMRPEGFEKMPNSFSELSPSYRFANPEGVARQSEFERTNRAPEIGTGSR